VVSNTGQLIQFGNACIAECHGYSDFVPCADDCLCPNIHKPVCVLTQDGQLLTFSNSCEAECAGYKNFFPCNHPHAGVPSNDSGEILKVFPNPSGGNFNIVSGLPEGSEITYQVVDLHGHVVFEETARSVHFEVLNPGFVPGIYFIKAFSQSDARSGRIVIR
jgi:hypothetical protein